jgi:hypothetical protein
MSLTDVGRLRAYPVQSTLLRPWEWALLLIDKKTKYWVQRPRFKGIRPNPSISISDDHLTLHYLCANCQCVFQSSKLLHGSWQLLVDSTETHLLHGSLNELRESAKGGCHFCSLLLNYIQITQQEITGKDESQCWITITTGFGNWSAHYNLYVGFGTPKVSIEPRYASTDTTKSPLRLQLMDPSPPKSKKISFDYKFRNAPSFSSVSTGSLAHFELASYWLRNCKELHSACCRTTDSLIVPTRLVDVGSLHLPQLKLHICQASDHELQYLTLSHCWGDVKDLLTLKTGNLQDLQNSIHPNTLPKTFTDAIAITRNLGVKYLWIDCLCIIQDNAGDWAREASFMGRYYENSQCTIAAASAENALQGCFSSRNPLTIARCHIAGPGSQSKGLYIKPAEVSTLDEVSPRLNTRGWVLQEEKLSRRTLTLGKTGIKWECKFGKAAEDDMYGIGTGRRREGDRIRNRLFEPVGSNPWSSAQVLSLDFLSVFRDGFSSSSAADFHWYWFSLVHDYSKRNLTYSSDKLVALSGLANAIKEIVGKAYAAGLWEDNLNFDLLWKTVGQSYPKPTSYRAPSWSWASVDGIICSAEDTSLDGKFQYQDTLSQMSISQLATIEFVEAVTASTDNNGTGQVLAGDLTIRGMLKEIRLSEMGHRLDTWEPHWDRKVFTDQQPLRFFPDSSDECEDSAFLLPMRMVRNKSDNPGIWQDDFVLKIEGLVLIHGEHGTFVRVGAFMLCSRKFEKRTAEWFVGCKERRVVVR